MIIISWQDLSLDALMGLIEAFIMREGTDYGVHEYSLEQKKEQLLLQVKCKEILIAYDEYNESTTLITKTAYNSWVASNQ